MESEAVRTLRRWEDHGGTWRVLRRVGGDATGGPATMVEISLRRCDGGEEADRLRSGAADLLAYIGDRRSNEA